jgi:predicted alpha-1,2-mannosidase
MKRYLCLIFILAGSCLYSQDLLQYVNIFTGTAPSSTESTRKHSEAGSEEKGQTFPAVGQPFGMTQWTPETQLTELKCISPYYYNDKYISGFRGSHWMSGSCTQDYGSATLMPFTSAQPDTMTSPPVSKLNHKRESASPAYYKIELDNFRITAEMTGTVRSGMLRFTFQGKTPGYVLIRMNSDEKEGRIWIDKENNEIVGFNPVHRIYQGWGKPAGFSGFFVIRANKPFKEAGYLKNNQQMVISFGDEKNVTFKVGSSFTGINAARRNLEEEMPDWNFEEVKAGTEKIWQQTLGKIIVGEGNMEDRIKFYTALYHCYQLPRIVSDCDGSYPGFADDTLIHKAQGFDYYDDFSMWDTYRALHPLLTILEPERTLNMIHSLVIKAEQGGWMPIFPAWSNYTAAMIGDHASAMICDSYLKGITGFDADEAYTYMRKNAFETPPEEEYRDGKGRRALKSYLEYGFIPMEDSVWEAFHKNEQVSRTIEYSFDDYALSRFAEVTGRENDAEILKTRSESWRNVFDTESGYVRGRYRDGSWVTPFDPFSKAKYICEGTPAQYTWYVPQNVKGLVEILGGKAKFNERLDSFFNQGYYWHGNEPGHQTAYLFALAGNPGKTQELVKSIIDEEYGTGPGGLSGNEDAGQMSAWLVFSMMGFYPVCPASNQYVITSPAFDEVRIRLPGGDNFLISLVNNKPGNKYIKAITKNGGVHTAWYITHEEIMKGSRFTFQMSDRPLPVE